MNNNETIFALSSGHGKSGVAVIRVSGDDLYKLFLKITNRKSADARHAYFANFRDRAGDLIDQVIAVYFAAPHSFTGTDVIEIHSHGAPAVVEKIFEYLRDMGGRMATPGEFSRRAFYNNKMDLADIDGLAALLDAQTDAQRKSALASMLGGDSEIYNNWRGQMIEISAYAAAMLDYADDELPANIGKTIRIKTKKLYDEITNAISRYAAVRAIRGGFNVALVGKTNVGKSSLFNAIVGANRAIVSDTPGTTRDVVSATIDMGGYMVNLSDTAGIRRATDAVEKLGIERTKSEIEISRNSGRGSRQIDQRFQKRVDGRPFHFCQMALSFHGNLIVVSHEAKKSSRKYLDINSYKHEFHSKYMFLIHDSHSHIHDPITLPSQQAEWTLTAALTSEAVSIVSTRRP